MNYPLASSTWDETELEAIAKVIESGRFTMGAKVREFEANFADYFGSKYAVMVNSGSSANLLAVAAMRYHSKFNLQPRDEVIVPAVSWSTTYYPLYQYGLKLNFVDVDIDSLNMNLDAVEQAITTKTKAIFAVNILGSPNNFDRLQSICDKHDLILLEDNCESMGATYKGSYTGTFGVCGTFSMFFSHHICTMEGGMVVTDDQELYEIVTSLRAHGWTRDLSNSNCLCDKSGDMFLDSYKFILPGYNVRPLEMSAAVGIHQLNKLDSLLDARRSNARHFVEIFNDLPYVRVQKPFGESSWFGFSIILEDPLAGRRDEIISALTKSGIESRPIIAGNFVRNPVIRFFDYETPVELPCADKVDRDGFFIGNHHFPITDELLKVKDILVQFAG